MREFHFNVRTPTFARLLDGRLTFHICVNNWGYYAEDLVCFHEFHGQRGATGRTLWKRVTWVGMGAGLAKGYICLALGACQDAGEA